MLLAGSPRAPRVVDRRTIALSDASVPTSRQPYHAVMGARPNDAPKVERRLRAIVQRVTRRSLTALLREYRGTRRIRGLALVVGSTIDPATIGNDHIRAHALEGQLFRTALEGAARADHLPCTTHVERALYDTAAARLKRPATAIKGVAAELGRAVDGPWRADEKTATVAAWLMLRSAH